MFAIAIVAMLLAISIHRSIVLSNESALKLNLVAIRQVIKQYIKDAEHNCRGLYQTPIVAWTFRIHHPTRIDFLDITAPDDLDPDVDRFVAGLEQEQ